MATKAVLVAGEERVSPAKRQEPGSMSKFTESIVSTWQEFSRFLSDVRGEMRKVVTPSRSEVKATTTVVIIAVFLFGLYFFVVDGIFQYGMQKLLARLGGLQQ